MECDLSDIFAKYEALVADVDTVFERVHEQYSDCVKCSVGCSDCCHALFDLSLIEAMYLNVKFNEKYSGQERSDILDRADSADRATYKIKRQAFKASRDGAVASEIVDLVSHARVRCSLLNGKDACDLYEFRPITCRLYGIPTAIGGRAHTCAKSGFEGGKQYPTVKIDKIQDRLMELSRELAGRLNSHFDQLSEMLVPVSMALMNKYDDEYLGIDKEKKPAAPLAAPVEEPAAPAPGKTAEKELSKTSCDTCGEAPGSSACSSCSGAQVWEFGAASEKK
ncbi:YkgJ family cysteine cluster protein [Desulfobaculum bizertense]|uniref:Putative zinc-or iron-chelating domain-containing protein n=1 Tax=Desulfobaculum bizertense DSM 18034 TaxID=1121442 RepID=A0A1T4WIS8_9BACT|nr:YkgJ family cysteine cluster protein [Desulfobaculum bizertense]UIJ37165.1 YkgJ family cysteine cluster protein [Desulfobaculum bizertense]SKA77230.1 Putative zinc-or iron-chelating domain-containing protein [Desulfobaculum bizertense DSM 18034]